MALREMVFELLIKARDSSIYFFDSLYFILLTILYIFPLIFVKRLEFDVKSLRALFTNCNKDIVYLYQVIHAVYSNCSAEIKIHFKFIADFLMHGNFYLS